MCKKQFLTYEDWGVHSDETNHGNCSLEDVIVDTIHHDAVYADVKEVVEKEWSEWDQTYKCTVCGDIMTEHVVCGAIDTSSYVLAYISDKGGEKVDNNGKAYLRFTANMPYGRGSDVNKKLTKDEIYKTYGYVYLLDDADLIYAPDESYLQLLKDHHFIQ